MSYINRNFTHTHSYHIGKKGYVNKFQKSLKSPFLNALHNHMPTARPFAKEETKIDQSDIAASDNIALSSAVVSATGASESDPGVNSSV